MCLCLLAICVRILHASFYFEIRGDASEYIELSYNLAKFRQFAYLEDGQLLSTAFRPILPTWLMSWFWTDDTFLTQSYLIFQAVIGGFSIFIAYLLISQIFSSRIAFITSLWGVFSPFMLQFSSTLLTEPVFTVLTLGGIYFLKSKNS